MKRQTTPYTRDAYVKAGCHQFGGDAYNLIATGIWLVADGYMCNGCPHARNRCKALATLSRPIFDTCQPVKHEETVRQESARLGVSISEVRRRRAAAVGAA